MRGGDFVLAISIWFALIAIAAFVFMQFLIAGDVVAATVAFGVVWVPLTLRWAWLFCAFGKERR